ncbi:unnamed protein product [Schistosoma curassoni]|uniref:N-acetyltransferase domain-containing protein n=1 Tax=Schistosoma curassoni TaxID=6186 RepID=A0A183L7V0_9TREM|nr:unnamed protein product [Schistosoma curassoni]
MEHNQQLVNMHLVPISEINLVYELSAHVYVTKLEKKLVGMVSMVYNIVYANDPTEVFHAVNLYQSVEVGSILVNYTLHWIPYSLHL